MTLNNNSYNNEHLVGVASIPPEILSQFEKCGVSIDPATFARILKEPKVYASFLQDLSILEKNPNEKSRFEQNYLKGFGQVVNIDGKELTFIQIAEMDPAERRKNEILGKLKSLGLLEAYQEWNFQTLDAANQRIQKLDANIQVANQQEQKIDTNIQAANQRIQKLDANIQAANQNIGDTQSNIESKIQNNDSLLKELKDLDTKLQSSTDQIRGLTSLPPDFVQKAQEHALKNPPKELQGLDEAKRKEVIQNGTYTNLIIADYAVSHANDISSRLSDADRSKFSNSIKEISGVLGRGPKNWPDIVETKGGLVLGPKRDEIKSTGDKIIREGYNKEVIWDANTRTLIFRGDRGYKAIETASLPPKERIILGTLSIGRTIAPESKARKEYDTLLGGTQKLIQKVGSEAYNSVLVSIATVDLTTLQEAIDSTGNNSYKNSLENYKRAKSRLESELTAGDTKDRIESLKALKKENKALDTTRKEVLGEVIKKEIDSPINPQARFKDPLELGEYELEREYDSLEGLEKLYRDIDQNMGQLKTLETEIKKEPSDTYDTDARNTLKYLQSIGYDILGQEVFEKIITSINREKSGQIKEIDFNKSAKLESDQEKELVRAIARVSRNSTLMSNWKNTNPDDEILAYRQMMSPNGKLSLQNLMKTVDFQQMIGKSPEEFQRYVYNDVQKIEQNNLASSKVPAMNTPNSAINNKIDPETMLA